MPPKPKVPETLDKRDVKEAFEEIGKVTKCEAVQSAATNWEWTAPFNGASPTESLPHWCW